MRLFSKKGTDLFGENPIVSPWKRPKTDLSQLADKYAILFIFCFLIICFYLLVSSYSLFFVLFHHLSYFLIFYFYIFRVTSVDTTRDGEWIVWTTEKYIAVVNTLFRGDNGETYSGFEKSMGKEKPQALICRLTDEDLALMGITEEDIHLTPATFDQGKKKK